MRAAASRFAKFRPGGNQSSSNKTLQLLTEQQYQQEKLFWRKYRHTGLAASAFALGVILVSLTTHQWQRVDGKKKHLVSFKYCFLFVQFYQHVLNYILL